jgi:hypothetical protein
LIARRPAGSTTAPHLSRGGAVVVSGSGGRGRGFRIGGAFRLGGGCERVAQRANLATEEGKMLDRTRHLRLALILIAGVSAGVFPILGPLARALGPTLAWAQDDDDDDDDGGDDDDDEGDDDDDGGDDEEEEEDEDQPKVTAGGLFVLKTYPISEIERPLTMTEGISEGKLGIGFDISNKTAFKSFGASLDFRYGYKDNVELQAGFKAIYNFASFEIYAALEAGIVYDFLDFRVAPVITRPSSAPTEDMDAVSGDVGFGIDVGFPFRYAPKPQVAVVAFDSLFQFDIVADDLSFDTESMTLKKDARPDAKPSIGIIVQPVPVFAIKLVATAQIPNFDFSQTDSIRIPAAASFQYSPKNTFDFGMEFTFNNLKPPDPDGDGPAEAPAFFDDRFLLFYAQMRVGR